MSPPPQASGPISRGIGSMAAIAARRWSQSLGAFVISAELKSGPAASRNDRGSIQTAGRGFGSGTSPATAGPPPAATSKRNIIKSRMAPVLLGITAFLRDEAVNVLVAYAFALITKPLRRPARRLTLPLTGEGAGPRNE